MADEELSAILRRREERIDGGEDEHQQQQQRPYKVFNPYTEFPEFSRKEIKEFEITFKKYDVGRDGFLDVGEVKLMMERLGAPQTHLALKEMMKQADQDRDDLINFREFLFIYHRARHGELDIDSGLAQLASLTEINVDVAGVDGAKNFFEAKIEEQTKGKKFEDEIRREQEEKRQVHEEQKQRRQEFREIAARFETTTSTSRPAAVS